MMGIGKIVNFFRVGRLLQLCGLLLAILLVACGQTLERHWFEFDANSESPDVKILAYRYGNSRTPGTYSGTDTHRGVAHQVGTGGEMPRGELLYVKWRVKSTGKEYEDTVDLKNRLPWDITNQTIHFVVDDTRLFVYLISADRIQPNRCFLHKERIEMAKTERPQLRVFRLHCDKNVKQIYPDMSQY